MQYITILFSADHEAVDFSVMDSGSEEASTAIQATLGPSLEAVCAKGVQNGNTAAVIEPEPSKNAKNESNGECYKTYATRKYTEFRL